MTQTTENSATFDPNEAARVFFAYAYGFWRSSWLKDEERVEANKRYDALRAWMAESGAAPQWESEHRRRLFAAYDRATGGFSIPTHWSRVTGSAEEDPRDYIDASKMSEQLRRHTY